MGFVMSQCVSSDLAAEQMAAGDAYQAQSDERVERGVMRQKQAQRAVRLACFVVLAIVALVAWFYLQR
jgi:CHASE3 domain sensor protein